jgi:hypothetical protein
MGRFQRSERGGEVDPREALRRAREAVTRERAQREEGHASDAQERSNPADNLEHVEDALREQQERDER